MSGDGACQEMSAILHRFGGCLALRRAGAKRPGDDMPSATLEEYLESIYKISLAGEVRPTQIADALGVSGPTVTATLRRLEAAGLVERPAGGVALTQSGMHEAVAVIRRHRIAERFLVDTLELPWEAAHEEACLLEHAMSPRVLEALERYLDNPSVCPHGHPIPTIDGVVPELAGVPLSQLGQGSEGVVVRVSEDRDEMLGYLASVGLRPGVRVRVTEVAPFDGPLLVAVQGMVHPLAREVAGLVSVEPDHPSA
jgi:DtxR family transcriptional regulator, Mn-dependent transcriptional regulator